jgi:hypothetical protein
VGGLNELAKGRSGYSAGQARDYLVNSGTALRRELVPQALREQFCDRQNRELICRAAHRSPGKQHPHFTQWRASPEGRVAGDADSVDDCINRARLGKAA